MYLYNVKVQCTKERKDWNAQEEHFYQTFTVSAKDESDAKDKAKKKADKEGYLVNRRWDARDSIVSRI